MLDIQFIRDNRELVKEKSKQKGYEVDVDKLLELDTSMRSELARTEHFRQKRNELSNQFKDTKPTPEQLEIGRGLKSDIASAETDLAKLQQQFNQLLKSIPNMPADDVPVGTSVEENVVVKQWGDKPQFDFQPKTHWQLAEGRGLIDKDRAAKVSGSRFAYIKGDLVKLQFAIMQYVVNELGNQDVLARIIEQNNLKVSPKPFIPVLPPAMIRTDVYDAMDRLEPREERYKVGNQEDDLWLQGSAEHTLGPMYMNEILDESELPIRYIGFLTSFRREAGTYGKDTEGIIRMHQFDKLEMESFTTPGNGLDEHHLMVAIQEYLTQSLGLAYQVLNKCTFDIGKPNARGIDIEIWMAGQAKYRETHTADYMTDYQSRRLNTRVKPTDGGALQYIHTNDATAFALGRLLVAIIENYQTADGHITVPEALKSYLGGLSII